MDYIRKMVCSRRLLEHRHVGPLPADQRKRFVKLRFAGPIGLIHHCHVAGGQLLHAGARRCIELREAHRVHQTDGAAVLNMGKAAGLREQFPHAGRVGKAGGLHQNHIRVNVRRFPQHLFKLIEPTGAEHRAAGDLMEIGP